MGFLTQGATSQYTAQAPNIQTQNLTAQLAALTPQQQALTQTLMNQANGQGVNPAGIALQQQTAQAIKQQAGANASVQGISPALAARMNAQNGAAQAQTAVGQGSLQEAQQQLASQGLASQNLLQQQSTLQGANAQQNSAINQGTLGAEGINANTANQNASTQGGILGGLMQGVGAVAALNKGGIIPHYADGGDVDDSNNWKALAGLNQPMTSAGIGKGIGMGIGAGVNALFGPTSSSIANKGLPAGQQQFNQLVQPGATFTPSAPPTPTQVMAWKGGKMPHYDDGGQVTTVDPNKAKSISDSFKGALGFKEGGEVSAMVSPGEKYLTPEEVEMVNKGRLMASKAGKKIPGKAKVKGDSPQNDIIPAKLEPGGVVQPRSVVNAPDKENKAKEFMQAVKDKKEKKPEGFSGVLKAKKHLQTAHEALLAAHKAMQKAA